MNIDFSQQIRLSIIIDFQYNQVILFIVIECYRLSILSIAQVGSDYVTGTGWWA